MKGRVLAAGHASGAVLRLEEPLSLWGGLDPASGLIIDPHHPMRGTDLTGRVLVMRVARGSSSSSSVLAEAARAGHAPAAVLLGEPDLILAVGSAVAAELYGLRIPVVVLDARDLERLPDRERVTVLEDGEVRIG
jgi:predicted aconitase with swiveling domain